MCPGFRDGFLISFPKGLAGRLAGSQTVWWPNVFQTRPADPNMFATFSCKKPLGSARCRIDARISTQKMEFMIIWEGFQETLQHFMHSAGGSSTHLHIPCDSSQVTSLIADSLQRSSAEAKLVAGFRYVLSYILYDEWIVHHDINGGKTIDDLSIGWTRLRSRSDYIERYLDKYRWTYYNILIGK